MAFDQRLEADYVDLSLGNILAHTPILGSLWSLLRGNRNNQDETKDEHDEGNDAFRSGGLARQKSGLPDLAQSSLSVWDTSLSSMSDLNAGDSNNTQQQQQLFQRSKASKKALSWTDMSGQGNLCEYFDYEEKQITENGNKENTSSAAAVALETPLPPTEPNMMTRSRSISKQLKSDGNYTMSSNSYQTNRRPHEQQRHSYLPRMDPQKPGIIMPSMHRSTVPHPSEQQHQGESPQYGFYVNLTPPSPELYVSSSKHQKLPSSHSVASTASTSTNGASPPNNRPIVAKPVNPIFQGLLLQQQRNNCNRSAANAASNFPSAPL